MDSTTQGRITALLGPTNTGKTHEAIQRMLLHPSGIIGLPLRLLAREVYERVAAKAGQHSVALITGEEKILPPRARYFICTVEAMPLERDADFVAIDEIQMCADPERGHIFTNRLLHARGRRETLFLGASSMRGPIADLVPDARFESRERFSTLTYAGSKKLSRMKPRSAVVAFSVDQVYAIAELIRRQRGGAAVVMGALSPRTRNAQVDLYQNGDVDYLVATDAIGMGLNMDVDHVAFAGRSKFDGRRIRHLMPNELAQIAGRAGRYTKDGTFGVTGEVESFEPEVVDAIENHRFAPIRVLQWRNADLRFGSVALLIRSLEEPPSREGLTRARESDDLSSLKMLHEDAEIAVLAQKPDRIRLLWDVCQIPDFRKTAPQEHATLLSRIYRFLLTDAAVIPSTWIAEQLRRIDRCEGDIDTLSKRLAFIRTWTYVANRGQWLEDAAEWRDETRAIEDRLGDALHAALTQRFVDRRSSVLMRRLKQKERLVAEVNDKGEVSAEGHYLGRLDGFRFTVDESATGEEIKTLRSASMSALAAEFTRRADKLYLSPDSEIDVTEQGGLMWGTDAIGKLEKGDSLLAPRVKIFVDDIAGQDVAEKVERRLTHWIGRRVQSLFEPLLAMRDDEAVTGLAKGVAYQLVEAMGIIPRPAIANDIKQLPQEDRALLRKHGVRFGQHNIFLPALLKPAPTRLRLILWSLAQGLDEFPEAPPPGHVTFPASPEMPDGYYEMVGYRRCGQRALRIDMLERLSDILRPMDVRGGFEASGDMLSITGCTLDQLADILQSLGFQAEKGERPKVVRKPASEADAAAPSEPGEGDAAPVAETEAEATAAVQAEGAEAAPAEEAQPDAAQPEVAEAQAAPAEAGAEAPVATEEAPAAEATETPEAGASGTGGSETDASETGAPEADASESGAPEPAASETETAAEADASAPEAEAEAASTEIETFYLFKLARRPRGGPRGERQGQGQGGGGRGRENNRGGGNRGGQQANRGEGQPGGQEKSGTGGNPQRRRGKGADFDGAGTRPDQGQKKDGGRRGKKGGKPPQKGNFSSGPKRGNDKPVDPDSPFAILQQLKKN